MKKKLDASKLSVTSFVTNSPLKNNETVKGGNRRTFYVTCRRINTVCNPGDTSPGPGYPCY